MTSKKVPWHKLRCAPVLFISHTSPALPFSRACLQLTTVKIIRSHGALRRVSKFAVHLKKRS